MYVSVQRAYVNDIGYYLERAVEASVLRICLPHKVDERLLYLSWYRDINFLLSYSLNGLVRGNTMNVFVLHQSIKIIKHSSAIFIAINWSLTADCWPIKVN